MCVRGEQHANAKLTEWQVREVRAWAALGWSQRYLAYAFEVNQWTICQVLRRRSWRHVE